MIQNLTSVTLKDKVCALTKLYTQTHEIKTQMTINTLTEYGDQINRDIGETEKEVVETHKVVQEN